MYNSWTLCQNMDSCKGVPFFPPPALSPIARNLVHMHVDIPAHLSKLYPHPCQSAPWRSSGPRAIHANSSVYPQEDRVLRRRPLQAWRQDGLPIPAPQEPEICSRKGHNSACIRVLSPTDTFSVERGMVGAGPLRGLGSMAPGQWQWWLVGGQEF